MHHKIFFQKLRLGPHVLKNRIVHPSPAYVGYTQHGEILSNVMAAYYGQRASAGMIVSEAIHVGSREYDRRKVPGLHTKTEIDEWRHVTSTVHEKGTAIVAKLTHSGFFPQKIILSEQFTTVLPLENSLSFPGVAHLRRTEVKPSTISFESMPNHLTVSEIKTVIEEFAKAARAALAAGFDGVEIQAGNNHLIHQFLSEQSNYRNDIYGGSLERRLTLLGDVVRAVTNQVGSDQVGVCVTPYFDVPDSSTLGSPLIEHNPHETYLEATEILETEAIAYLSISEAEWAGAEDLPTSFRDDMRRIFSGRIISSGNYTTERAEHILSSGWSDLVGFGKPFIVNPDLPERIASGWPLA